MKNNLYKLLAAIIALGLFVSACQSASGAVAQSNLDRDINPETSPSELQELVAGNTAFALDMYRAICLSQENLFFSPYSISVALAMTYAGARGETASQIVSTMHFSLPEAQLHPTFNSLDFDLVQRDQPGENQDDPQFVLNVVNSMWGQIGWSFQQNFLDLLALNYGAGIRLVDFKKEPEDARKDINQWVSDETNEKIKDLIPEGVIDPYTTMVLVNAIYFNAAWEHEFSKSKTTDAPFTLLDGSQVNVPMMSFWEAKSLEYGNGDGWQAVSLRYEGDLAEMVIFLPDAGKFDDFEAGFTAERIGEILSGMNWKGVALSMPKFNLTCDYGLKNILSSMGMPLAFDEEQADFSGIDGKKLLYIQDVVHKAFVKVDEEGTEAAAATGVIMAPASITFTEIELKVDRPFIFLIRDTSTGSILFMGRVLNPSE